MTDVGRSQDDVERAIAAILWRHSRTDPTAAWSRCSGGEVGCARPMDADGFQRHQARAVVDEVFVPEFDSFVQRTRLAERTIESITGTGPSPRKRWWFSRFAGWLIFALLAAGTLVAMLRS